MKNNKPILALIKRTISLYHLSSLTTITEIIFIKLKYKNYGLLDINSQLLTPTHQQVGTHRRNSLRTHGLAVRTSCHSRRLLSSIQIQKNMGMDSRHLLHQYFHYRNDNNPSHFAAYRLHNL